VTRVNLTLLALAAACALGVVTSQHRARQLFTDLENEQAVAKKLEEERTQLQLESSTWATHKRVEAIASKGLAMKLPDAASTVVVDIRGAAPQGDPKEGRR
jgi:cell division protein FtsL